MNVKRIDWIDSLKAYAIMLVVIGHIIQRIIDPYGYNSNIFFNIIYGFHMPLFMFISGFLTFSTSRKIDLKWLKRRFFSLAIPFIAWTFIYYLVRLYIKKSITISLIDFLISVAISPDNSAWFIWVLFLCDIVLYFIQLALIKLTTVTNSKIDEMYIKAGLCFISIMIIMIFNHYVTSILGVGFLSGYIIYFLFGNLYHCYISKKDNDVVIKNRVVYILAIAVSLCLLCLYSYFKDVALNSCLLKIFGYIAAIVGIISSIYLIKLIPHEYMNKLSILGGIQWKYICFKVFS